MSDRLRQRLALLLVAVMALLPLQGAQAIWSGPAGQGHCQQSESRDHGGHHGQTAGHKAGCCASQAATGGNPDHQCNSCDLCGGATAAVFDLPITATPSLRDIPLAVESSIATVQRHSPLLRPPSNLH